ncbi:MAG: CDP-diacylglycerol--serine O-phosphatidyltransferase [Pseudomonadota bacterium]
MEDAFPPFEPDGDHGHKGDGRQRLRDVPLRFVVPNIVTVLAMCSSLSAIRMAFEDRYEMAVTLIAIAALLDGLDGRIARLMKAASRFGKEMDSLADVVNFGVVPALVLYAFALEEAKPFGWTAALLYSVACALRLARFNILADDANRPKWQQAFFVGVPAPVAAMLVLLPVYLGFLGYEPGWYTANVAAFYTIGVGILMVSNLPVWSGKSVGRIPKTSVVPVIMGVALFVAVLASFPWSTLTACVVGYLIFLPFSLRMWRKARRVAEAVETA